MVHAVRKPAPEPRSDDRPGARDDYQRITNPWKMPEDDFENIGIYLGVACLLLLEWALCRALSFHDATSYNVNRGWRLPRRMRCRRLRA